MRCDTYAFGNCTAGVCQDFGWVPDDLGDGGDWAATAAARGFTVTMVPTVGAVVCYGRGDGYSPFGHVAEVLQIGQGGMILVREMNFVAFDVYDTRWSDLGDVVGFILAPGTTPGQGTSGQGSGQVGGGGTFGVPDQVVGAWENVRSWTRDLGAQLYGNALDVETFADSIS